MKKDQIIALALANGFKLKQQPNGEMALNPYVFDFANAIAEKITPAWIPCSERMPEEGVDVLCYLDFGFGNFFRLIGCYSANPIDAGWHSDQFENSVPSHWMSLPEPPKDES